MVWMISANGTMYDHASSFATNNFIDWRQQAKYSIGDIIYIYCTAPIKKVMYKCEVIKCNMKFKNRIPSKLATFFATKAQAQNSSKQKEENNLRGTKVIHKTYGKGIITKHNKVKKQICIEFDCGEKTFIVEALERGLLKTAE